MTDCLQAERKSFGKSHLRERDVRRGHDHGRRRGVLPAYFFVHAPIDKSLQLAGPHRVLKLADGLGLDLADALARDLEDPADLFEGVCVPVADAVAELDDLTLAVSERAEHLLDALLEHV